MTLVSQAEGNIGPEAGVTYTLRIYGETDNLLHTYSNLTGTSQTYTLTKEINDSGLGRANANLRIELESMRNGVTSWQQHSISFERS